MTVTLPDDDLPGAHRSITLPAQEERRITVMTNRSTETVEAPISVRSTGIAEPVSAAGLRVLIVTVVHDPEDARIRHRQLASLLEAGASVTYAAPFSAFGRTPPVGVRALDLPRARGKRRLGAVRAARATVRAEAAHHDVVLVHDPELVTALWNIPRAARAAGVVPVWDVHEDTAAALGMRSWLPGVLRGPAALAVRALESRAERTVELLLAEDAYSTRFRSAHPVVPNSSFVPAAEPLPAGDSRVVYLGRLTRARGALELVELGRRLAGSGLRLELIGPADADCADQIDQAHRSGLLYHHGFVPNDIALQLLDGACAGLSLLHDEPNYAHSRPTKLMEYMGFGVPVVTTPNAVSVDLVKRFDCGLVVPFGDVGAAESAVRRLAADRALRERTSQAGRTAALEYLDWRQDGRRFVAQLDLWANGTTKPPVRVEV